MPLHYRGYSAANTGSANSTSARAELEQQISYMNHKSIAENDLMRQYLNDTTINGIDSVIAYLETQKDQ